MQTFLLKKLQTGNISFQSFLITLVVTVATFGIAFIPSASSELLIKKFMPGHARLFGMYDSLHQRLGHQVGLIILVLMVFTAMLLRNRQKYILPTRSKSGLKADKYLNHLPGVLLLAGALISVLVFNTFLNSTSWLFVSLLLVIVYIKFSDYIRKRRLFVAAWIAIISYLIYLIVPAFLVIPHVPEAELGAVQFHHAIVLSWADRLAINPDYFAQRLPHYGLALSSLLGAYQHHFGLLDFGQHIRIIQASQALFLLLCCLALYLWKPQRPIYVFVALLLFGTFASTSHAAIFYPNQSGWRFIGFPLWIILLLTIKRMRLRQTSFILGCASVILLLFNLETGIAITVGTIAFLLSREQYVHWRKRMNDAIVFILGGLVAMLAFCIPFWAEFSHFPFSFSSLISHRLISHFNEGYGGLRLKFDVLSIFIFMHCVYLVSSIILRWRTRGIGYSLGIKLAIATAILVWFSYYMNRPDLWNMWIFLFLFSFLIIDFIDRRPLILQWRRFGIFAFTDIRVAALTWLLLPFLLQINDTHLDKELQFIADAKNTELAPISGVNLHKDLVKLLKDKVVYLERLSDKNKTIYLSRDDELIPLMTKQLNPFDVQDVYLENFGQSEFEQVVHEIRISKPEYIIMDDPLSPLIKTDFAFPKRSVFFHKVINELADQYREVGTMSGWEIWQCTVM